MKKIIMPIAIAACVLPVQFVPAAPRPDVKEIMSKPFLDIPGKEGLVLTVTYPPGGADEIHRHDAHAFVYVLEGSVVMQLRGAEPVTLKAGETFYREGTWGQPFTYDTNACISECVTAPRGLDSPERYTM